MGVRLKPLEAEAHGIHNHVYIDVVAGATSNKEKKLISEIRQTARGYVDRIAMCMDPDYIPPTKLQLIDGIPARMYRRLDGPPDTVPHQTGESV